MTDPVQELLQLGLVDSTPFPPTSRYHAIAIAKFVTADGREVLYLRRRFVPSPDRFTEIQVHFVKQGDRLDNVTAHYLGDPEQFWQLCDANGALKPSELTDTVGRTIRITLPEGVPGPAEG